ncbi:MAG: 3-methyl-2-oxobutanoate dehydrogenase subunit VorB [Candidatus Firestonebacteria bacterium]
MGEVDEVKEVDEMKKILIKGNEAIAEAAVRAGCRFYAGYPITPQNQIPEYMSWRMPEVGGVFIQAESELAAINMVMGASLAGVRAMTSSSSPGISLKMEGISYLAALELPAVIINMQRGGPGLGSIQGSQADYFQAVKGGGHGDYRLIVQAPTTIQEAIDLTVTAFDLADLYRIPVMILSDGILGQMMESAVFKEISKRDLPPKDWALDGCKGRKPRCLYSLMMAPGILERHNWHLAEKYKIIEEKEIKCELYKVEDAEILIVAQGIVGRISKGAVELGRTKGVKIGLVRPITLWPFPDDILNKVSKKAKKILVVEQNLGQMIEDVKLAVVDKSKVFFYGRPGGGVPSPEEIMGKVKEVKEVKEDNPLPPLLRGNR